MLEDISDISDYLDYGGWMNRRLHAGVFARPQERIGDKAREASIPVTYVESHHESDVSRVRARRVPEL